MGIVRKAFTLSEVLIALGIVGILAALLMPALYNIYADKVKSTQLKKAYSQIALAIDSIMTDERAMDSIVLQEGGSESPTGFYVTSAGVKTSSSSQGAEFFLNKYFRHTQVNCGSGGSSSCVAANYKTPDKESLGGVPAGYYCIKTVNSAAICMKFESNVMKVLVDVNATGKPNISGSDVFVFYITDKGVLKDLDSNSGHCNASGNDVVDYASGCFSKVMENGWRLSK